MAEAHPIDRATRSLRLLWLIDSLTLGGAESLVPAFARGLDRSDVNLVVACLKSIGGNPVEETLREQGVKVVNLHARNLRDLRAFRRLTRLLRVERIDLVHAHLTYASIWAGLAARRTRVPALATLHVAATGPEAGTRERMREKIMVGSLNRWASRIVAVSDAVRSSFAGRLDPTRTVVVPNGVDTDRFERVAPGARAEIRRELGIAADAPLLITVSVLREGKGLERLLRVVSSLAGERPQLRLVLVGSGPLEAALRAEKRALGLDGRVVFAGYRRDVPRLLAAADLFVLASRFDAFPTVLLEAMAAGLPVLATRVGGIPEIVRDGETGTLVEPGDDKALAAAIDELLGNPDRLRRMGASGRERVRSELSAATWIARLRALYDAVLDEGGR